MAMPVRVGLRKAPKPGNFLREKKSFYYLRTDIDKRCKFRMTLISQDTNVHTFNNVTWAQVDDGNVRGLLCCLITMPFSHKLTTKLWNTP